MAYLGPLKLADLLQLKPHPFICRKKILIKKFKIEKTKPTFIISDLKAEYYVVLVSLISNFFSNKISHANKWMRKKIRNCSNSALFIGCGVSEISF